VESKRVKKIKLTEEQKKAKYLSRVLEGALLLRNGLVTVSLTREEIYTLLTETKLVIKADEEVKELCIEYEE
jgi:hypothetical protein